MTNELKGIQLFLRILTKGKYNKVKSGDGQFTGGYYQDVYELDGIEYHLNWDSIETFHKHPVMATNPYNGNQFPFELPVYTPIWSNK